MIDLNKLNVSLTKHGAHKIAELIQKFDIEEVLNHVDDRNLGIHIDLAQARKNLSFSRSGIIPEYWKEIKKHGDIFINHCVLFTIIFSHYKFILAMQRSKGRFGIGLIKRDEILRGKEYTNFACIFRELGFSENHNTKYFEYNFSTVFNEKSYSAFIKRIINDKLNFAGKEYPEVLIDVCIENNFNYIFGLNQQEFRKWIASGETAVQSPNVDLDYDFEEDQDINDFTFEQGHLKRSTDKIEMRIKEKNIKVTNLHDEIQDELYDELIEIYGKNCVGSENDTGFGVRIDLVVKEENNFTFYEIKTDNSLRKCIRSAFSQLMEYTYWPDQSRSNKLIIVSPNEIYENAKKYLQHLRKKFNIPLYYQQYIENEKRFTEIV